VKWEEKQAPGTYSKTSWLSQNHGLSGIVTARKSQMKELRLQKFSLLILAQTFQTLNTHMGSMAYHPFFPEEQGCRATHSCKILGCQRSGHSQDD
jgi:hypothetical protein